MKVVVFHGGGSALSDQGDRWALLNVVPNLPVHLLQPHAGLGDGEVRSVVLTDSHIDHVGGLLNMREGSPIDLYATPAVFETLSQGMPVLQVLQQYCGVHWHVIPVAGETLSASFRVDGLPGLEFTALATEGLSLPGVPRQEAAWTTGHSIALGVRELATGQRLFCAPGAQWLGAGELDWMRDADCVLVDDHTRWPDEAPVATWRAQRKVLLGKGVGKGAGTATQRASTDGFEAAFDGMVIEL